MPNPELKRSLLVLGYATCQLPLLVSVAIGWWAPWVGVAAGILVSVCFAMLWARRAKQPLFMLGAVAGVGFSVMGASLLLPSLRLQLGASPTYELGTQYKAGSTTPMAVELVTIPGGAPRADLLYMGEVTRYRGGAGYAYLYSVVAPIVPPDWQPSSPVPAWVICEVSREETGKQAEAEQECKALLAAHAGAQPASYEHEGFDTDLPNAPMVQKAMQQLSLTQTPNAPIFVLAPAGDTWPGIIAPLVMLLLSMGFVAGRVNKRVKALASTEGRSPPPRAE